MGFRWESPGSSNCLNSWTRHHASPQNAACVVSNKAARPIRATGSWKLPVVWQGPRLKWQEEKERGREVPERKEVECCQTGDVEWTLPSMKAIIKVWGGGMGSPALKPLDSCLKNNKDGGRGWLLAPHGWCPGGYPTQWPSNFLAARDLYISSLNKLSLVYVVRSKKPLSSQFKKLIHMGYLMPSCQRSQFKISCQFKLSQYYSVPALVLMTIWN